MGIIVDVNVARRVLLVNADPDYCDLTDSLFGRRRPAVRLVYDGRSFQWQHALRRKILELERAARAIQISAQEIDRETRKVERYCRSNDSEVIGLARASGARLLCSLDQDLCRDFKNRKLLSNPPGKIYGNRAHNHLLSKYCKDVGAE